MASVLTFNSKKSELYEVVGWPKVVLDYRSSREYTFLQLHEISEGLRCKVDVSVYADPSFNHHQMYALRIGLQNGLDVSDLAHPSISWMDMLRALEERDDGLVYVPGAEKEKRFEMPSIEELEQMLLQEPVVEEVKEEPVGLEEIYESLPDDMRSYLSNLLGEASGIDVDINAAKDAATARVSRKAFSEPEIG